MKIHGNPWKSVKINGNPGKPQIKTKAIGKIMEVSDDQGKRRSMTKTPYVCSSPRLVSNLATKKAAQSGLFMCKNP